MERPQAFPPAGLPVLLEHGPVLVVDKPAGLAVGPGRRQQDSVEGRLQAGLARGRATPRAVHRLDQDTSGCLLLATRPAAHRALAAAFAERSVIKLYLAVVEPAPPSETGRIDAALAKISSRRDGWRMRIAAEGAPARTRWQLLERHGDAALLLMRPETGRTHQLRVHAGALAPGTAIVGDPLYGTAQPGGMLLHAAWLLFPWDGRRHGAHAPCPARFPGWARAAAGRAGPAQLSGLLTPSEASIADAIRSASGR